MIGSFVLASVLNGPVETTELQRVTLQHVAEATIVQRACDTMRVNNSVMASVFLEARIAPSELQEQDGRRFDVYSVELGKAAAFVKQFSEDIGMPNGDGVCLIGTQLYGPDGTAVKNLLVPK